MSPCPGKSLIKIAVAEDHVMFREALCHQINTWDNCKVMLQAGHGEELLKGLNSEDLPDIVLLDLNMPVMNGFETMEELKKFYPSVKTLVVSMYSSEEVICRILKSGANGFVNKVEDMGKIRRAVNDIIKVGYFFSDHAASQMVRHVLQTGRLALRNDLSEEELKFLRYICSEKTYKAIASEMGISGRHAEYLRYNLFERFEVQSRTGLAIMAMEKGLVI